MGLIPLVSAGPISSRQSNTTSKTSSGYNNVVYFADWDIYARNYQPAQLPVKQLTHVLYAFANIKSDGTVMLADTYADLQKHYPSDSWDASGNNVYGCIKQLYLLKQQNRKLKVLLSIGGWTYSPTFPTAFSTSSGRAKFAQTATQFVQDLGLDGLDIDYEYPASASQAGDFTQAVQELRSSLDAYTQKNGGSQQLLTVACPAGPQNYKALDLQGMAPYVDMWNLMAYDYDGSFGNATGHQANLFPAPTDLSSTPFNTDQAISYYISQGIPAGRINLGMPIYGRSFVGTAGLGKPFAGVGPGSWQPGVWDYKALPLPNSSVLMDHQVGATYSWDAGSKTLISYDTPSMVRNKTSYILNRRLGGSMFWEASSDRNDSGSLIGASWNALSAAGPMDSTINTINYPASQYDNLRNHMNGSTLAS